MGAAGKFCLLSCRQEWWRSSYPEAGWPGAQSRHTHQVQIREALQEARISIKQPEIKQEQQRKLRGRRM